MDNSSKFSAEADAANPRITLLGQNASGSPGGSSKPTPILHMKDEDWLLRGRERAALPQEAPTLQDASCSGVPTSLG